MVRYLASKANLRCFRDVQRICRVLDPYLHSMMLGQINGDAIWAITQGELKRGNAPATVNRYLSLVRNVLRTARDEYGNGSTALPRCVYWPEKCNAIAGSPGRRQTA